MGNHVIDVRKKRIFADKIHWNCQKVDNYNKIWNICISARGTAKTTKICKKVWKRFVHNHERFLLLRRRQVDLTEGYVNSVANTINKFLPCHKRIKLYFNKGDLQVGQCDVYLDKKRTKLFFRIQALSLPSERAKSNFISDVGTIWFDEQIPNQTNSFLPKEVQLLRDVYSTYSREYDREGRFTKIWITGNPYTLFNPVFSYLNIPLTEIKPGALLVGKDYVLDFPIISPELKDFILKTNPDLLKEDEYVNYALNGIVLNDLKYNVVEKKPQGMKLKYVFRVGGLYLLVWRNSDYINMNTDKYWVESTKEKPTTNKMIISTDFDNLIQDTRLITNDVRIYLRALREAIARRNISYSSIESAILVENIYKSL